MDKTDRFLTAIMIFTLFVGIFTLFVANDTRSIANKTWEAQSEPTLTTGFENVPLAIFSWKYENKKKPLNFSIYLENTGNTDMEFNVSLNTSDIETIYDMTTKFIEKEHWHTDERWEAGRRVSFSFYGRLDSDESVSVPFYTMFYNSTDKIELSYDIDGKSINGKRLKDGNIEQSSKYSQKILYEKHMENITNITQEVYKINYQLLETQS